MVKALVAVARLDTNATGTLLERTMNFLWHERLENIVLNCIIHSALCRVCRYGKVTR